MIVEEIVDFLFWLQYPQTCELFHQWNEGKASNRFVANKYLEYLKEAEDD